MYDKYNTKSMVVQKKKKDMIQNNLFVINLREKIEKFSLLNKNLKVKIKTRSLHNIL